MIDEHFNDILLNEKYNIRYNNIDYKLLPLERCIHEDIRNNNIDYCKHKQYENNINKNTIINNLIVNLNLVHQYVTNNIEQCKHFYLKQSCDYLKIAINSENIIDNFKQIFVKQFSVININYNIFDSDNLTLILLNSNIKDDILEQIFVYIFKEFEKQTNINIYIFDFILLCIEYKKLNLSINACNYIQHINDYNIYNSKINTIIDKILNSNVSNNLKIKFLKILQLKNINNLTLYNIIDYECSNSLIELFNSNNLIILSNNYNDVVSKSILKNKINVLKYSLDNYKDLINNPYISYFNNINNDKYDYDKLKLITKYNYDINIKIDINCNKVIINGDYNLLYYCIINNYNNSARILINNGIDVNDIYGLKTLLHKCIDENNTYIGNLIIKKNPEIIKIKYKSINTPNYVFNFVENDFIKFMFIKYFYDSNNLNLNEFDEDNKPICFDILNMNNKKLKIILFNLLVKHINSKIIYNDIPLILTSILLNELEITYIMLQTLLKNNNIKINHLNENNIYKYKLIY